MSLHRPLRVESDLSDEYEVQDEGLIEAASHFVPSGSTLTDNYEGVDM
jgi:hypothetical protein